MIKSMTGFGRCEIVTDEYKISVEMKAVNHRYLDLSIKMPKKFNYFESAIRTLLKGYIQRGKVDVFINYEDYTEGNLCLKYNRSLAVGVHGVLSGDGAGVRDPQRYEGIPAGPDARGPDHGAGAGG